MAALSTQHARDTLCSAPSVLLGSISLTLMIVVILLLVIFT